MEPHYMNKNEQHPIEKTEEMERERKGRQK